MSGRKPTPSFGAMHAGQGYALNSMCHSLAGRAAQEAFLRDEDAYCRRFRLTLQQREAVLKRDISALIAMGGAAEQLSRLPS